MIAPVDDGPPSPGAFPLDAYRYFLSEDLGETRRLTSQRFRDHRMATTRSGEAFQAVHNAVDCGGVAINFIRYSLPTRITAEPLREFYLLVIPLEGEIRMTAGAVATCAAPGSALVMPCDCATALNWQAGASAFVLRVDRTAFQDTVAARRTLSSLDAPRFVPRIEMSAGAGRYLDALVRFAVNQLDTNPWCAATAAFGQTVEASLLDALAASPFHDAADALQSLRGERPSPAVARASDFMRSHLKEPITLEEVAAASGVGVRALQDGFRRSHGVSPMTQLRRLRLAAARKELLAARHDTPPITEVALRFGFGHPGRFARAYREMFGETPSRTRRR